MEFQEQFEKETGTERPRRCDSFDYEYAYMEWLEKKIGEVSPLKGMVSDNEGGLSKEAKAAIRWLHSPIAQEITVKQARETIEQVWGKEVSEEVRKYTQA